MGGRPQVRGDGSLARFRDLYAPWARAAIDAGALVEDGVAFAQPPDNAAWCVAGLPRALRVTGADRAAARASLSEALRRAVFRSSAAQTLKGLLTADPGKASAYALAKWRKGRKR